MGGAEALSVPSADGGASSHLALFSSCGASPATLFLLLVAGSAVLQAAVLPAALVRERSADLAAVRELRRSSAGTVAAALALLPEPLATAGASSASSLGAASPPSFGCVRKQILASSLVFSSVSLEILSRAAEKSLLLLSSAAFSSSRQRAASLDRHH